MRVRALCCCRHSESVASGFTGRLIVRYLHQHPQRQKSSSAFTLAIAGRSSSKLNELVISLGLGSDVEAIVVDTSNYDDVEKAVTRSKVVINCVGPFWKYSFGVVRCVRHVQQTTT